MAKPQTEQGCISFRGEKKHHTAIQMSACIIASGRSQGGGVREVVKTTSQNVSKWRRVSLATGIGAVSSDHPLAMSGDGARVQASGVAFVLVNQRVVARDSRSRQRPCSEQVMREYAIAI